MKIPTYPKFSPRRTLWLVLGFFFFGFLLILSIDLNGNICLSSSGKIPDLLHPAPQIIAIGSMGISALIAGFRAWRHQLDRFFWLIVFGMIIAFLGVIISPALKL